jgi:hypothetical protein
MQVYFLLLHIRLINGFFLCREKEAETGEFLQVSALPSLYELCGIFPAF